MSTLLSKNTVKKSAIQIVKQDELDELDELSILLEKPNNISTINNNTNHKKLTIKPKTFKSSVSIEAQSKLIDDTLDLYDNLDNDLKNDLYNNLKNEVLPKNYGNRWSENDKQQLIYLLKESSNKDIDYLEIANKLGRSEGGVKGELKKIIMSRYLNGEEPDMIALDINIQYKFVKILIKTYIDNEIDSDINNLEKENKLLKLKMENIELRKNISKLVQK